MGYPSIDELCRGMGTNVKRVLESTKRQRSMNRVIGNGYSKKRTHRMLADIPVELYINPRSPLKQFFDNDMDKHERQKHIAKFLRLYPEFMTVDKR